MIRLSPSIYLLFVLLMNSVSDLLPNLRFLLKPGTATFRRFLLFALDGLSIVFAFSLALQLRLAGTSSVVALSSYYWKTTGFLLPWALFFGLGLLYVSGWYRVLIRYSKSFTYYLVLPWTGLASLLLLLVATLHGHEFPPRSFWILFWLSFSGFVVLSRVLLRDSFRFLPGLVSGKPIARSILIYGAGNSGVSLLGALEVDKRFRVEAFVDDDLSLRGRSLMGVPICCPDDIPSLISRYGVQQILLAMPSMSRKRRFDLTRKLSFLDLKVLETPSLSQIASGERLVSELAPISILDLLGREPSRPDPDLLKSAVFREVVLVTGAGGSIGSALCRSVLDSNPGSLVLFERNEYALYSIERELLPLARHKGVEMISVLGDVMNQRFVESVLTLHRVTVLLHAAAYKHVPLVEQNVCAGLSNNILGTRSVLDAALRCRLKRFTLISTDKAVRPTNAMGASKRVCELLVQAASEHFDGQVSRTVCSMVRFGNVLGSSGSVVPLFQEQIERGGPITLTHLEITRYFMTIQEAALLVLQATGMASGGEVFVLDMGEPVRLYDMARQMIALAGCTLRDEQNPDGDIEIQVTGLRPGEKLFEELLISDNDLPTQHSLIRKARERRLAVQELTPLIDQMVSALDAFDSVRALELLRCLVPEYQAHSSPQ